MIEIYLYNNIVALKEVGRILKSLGHNPSDAELQVLYVEKDLLYYIAHHL